MVSDHLVVLSTQKRQGKQPQHVTLRRLTYRPRGIFTGLLTCLQAFFLLIYGLKLCRGQGSEHGVTYLSVDDLGLHAAEGELQMQAIPCRHPTPVGVAYN